MNRRFKLLLIFAILFETVTLSQSVQELESELKNKPISNPTKTRKIAKELLKIDKYNETGILYVVATFYPLEDSISAFFENLINSDSENPIPYILRAKYENFNQHSSDSDNVTFLKKAYQLDYNNREANHLLGLAYYSMFIDSESRGKKFYAENSKKYLTNLYNLDKYSINETRYPLTQSPDILMTTLYYNSTNTVIAPRKFISL
jgi:beta-glucosidase/6-phospho-beta-glucosidase/beta-galactosidase